MSKNSNLVGEIKSLMVKFGFLKAEMAKLIDGTEIRVEGDELVEGAAVYVVTEEGDVPAPDGIHELEDGTKVETAEGLIKSIEMKMEDDSIEESPEGVEEVQMEEEIVEEEKVEEEMEEDVIEVEVPGVLPAEVAAPAVEAIVEAIVPILEHVKELEEELKKVKASFEAFRNQPAGSPVNKTKKDFKVQDSDELARKILALKNAQR